MGVTVNNELLTAGTEQVMPAGVYVADELIPADRVLLFEANGRRYTAPRTVSPAVVFRYLRAVRHDEGEKAMADMMYEVLGAAVIDALADEDLSPEEYDQVMRVIRKHVMGATEATLGNSSNGRRR